MTGYRSVKQVFAKSYQQSREKIQANNNNPTEDLKDALENCTAEVTDIFRTGPLLSHAASRVGAADWAEVMRARVGAEIGRAACRERVCQYVLISGVAVSLNKKIKYYEYNYVGSTNKTKR